MIIGAWALARAAKLSMWNLSSLSPVSIIQTGHHHHHRLAPLSCASTSSGALLRSKKVDGVGKWMGGGGSGGKWIGGGGVDGSEGKWMGGKQSCQVELVKFIES